MLIHRRTVADIGRVDFEPMCLAQHPRRVLLALLDRSQPYVRTGQYPLNPLYNQLQTLPYFVYKICSSGACFGLPSVCGRLLQGMVSG